MQIGNHAPQPTEVEGLPDSTKEAASPEQCIEEGKGNEACTAIAAKLARNRHPDRWPKQRCHVREG